MKMNVQLTLHGTWPVRNETVNGVATDIVETFERLGKIAPEWNSWYRTYHTVDDWRRPPVILTNNIELILSELQKGQVVRDSGQIVHDLGYTLRAFAGPKKGQRGEKTEFYVSCCHRTAIAGPNVLSLELPNSGPGMHKLMNQELLASAICSLVDIWNPDWLIVWDLLTRIVPPPWPNGPTLGWINYIAPRVATIAKLPPCWKWSETRLHHQVFIHEGGPPQQENKDHGAAFAAIYNCIQWHRSY
jgi:hypothetical protein